MAFIAGVLLNRRRQRLERRRAALSDLNAPPREHPLLGLGGRSIELSLALREPVSAEAVVLAADLLHDFALRLRAHGDDVTENEILAARSAASFLMKAADGVELTKDSRDLLSQDADAIAGSS